MGDRKSVQQRRKRDYGDPLKDLRDAKCMTQQQLADALGKGWTLNRVYDLENGRTRLTEDAIRDLAKELGDGVLKLKPAPRKRRAPPQSISEGLPIADELPIEVVLPSEALPGGPPGSGVSEYIETIVLPYWGGGTDRWSRRIVGTSMADEFVDGDIVIFESLEARNMQAVHAIKDGEETFKIYRKTSSGAYLWPLNEKEHEPISANGWEIRGVCIARWRFPRKGEIDKKEWLGGYTWHPDEKTSEIKRTDILRKP